MFQFSTQCEEMEDLTGWLNHFHRMGRPAGIVEHKGKYSLWRGGSGVRQVAASREYYIEKPVGELVVATNGFKREWRGK